MLSFYLNIPTTHNHALLDALRAEGTEAVVTYRRQAAATGRTWEPTARDIDSPAMIGRRTRDDIVLSGGWAHPVEVTRRLVAPFRARSVHWWGERLKPTTTPRSLMRTAWFRAPGLDGILAIGSAATDGYRDITADKIPVHEFPYVTDRGIGTAPRRADEPVFGFVGRLLPYKGPDLAVRCLQALPAGVLLEVVGTGPMRAELERLAADLGVRVRFVGASAPDALDELRRRWWCQIVPNRATEGWGMAVNEALGAGIPVVATSHVTAALDLVRTGANGTLVPSADAESPEALAAAVGPLLEPRTQAEMSALAQAIGAASSATAAAPWLLRLLRERPSEPRSFLAAAWAHVDSASTGHDS